jgi:hypothetical protein
MRSATTHLLLGLLILVLVVLAPLALIAYLVVMGAKTLGISFSLVGILGVVAVSLVMGIVYLIVLLAAWRTFNLPRLLGRIFGRAAGTMVGGLRQINGASHENAKEIQSGDGPHREA